MSGRRIATLDETGRLPTGVVTIPRGLIYLWAGKAKDIPKGWILCDGTNGTPDLGDLFTKLKTNPPICIMKE